MKIWKWIAILSLLTQLILVAILYNLHLEKKEQVKHYERIEENLRWQNEQREARIKELELALASKDTTHNQAITYTTRQENDLFVSYQYRSSGKLRLSMSTHTSVNKRIGTFQSLQKHYKNNNKELHFATNAGIFRTDHKPLGLFVTNGKEQMPLLTSNGNGNFFLKPNGVFYISQNKIAVKSTEEYQRLNPKVQYATQSGPMLVINGNIHPAFNKGSANKKVRSGVGQVNDSTAVFVLSKAPINFFDFASFFRDKLHCQNALYLDGVISGFHFPDQHFGQLHDYAAFITVWE